MVLSPFGGLFQPCWSRSDRVVPFRMKCVTLDVERHHLVSCPRNTRYFAGGRLAVFQGASEAPISLSYGSSEQRGKTANWPPPRGLRSKWAGGCVARRSRIASDMLPPSASPARTALPAAHFDRNKIPRISGTGHWHPPLLNV